MRDYPCGKFGDCPYDRTKRPKLQTDRHRHIDTRTDADERFTPATLVGVSNYRHLPETRVSRLQTKFAVQ